MNAADFYKKSYPKSLDNAWGGKHLLSLIENNPEKIPSHLRTIVEHIAYQIAQSIQQVLEKEAHSKASYTLLATGGGAFNVFLMERLQAHCTPLR